MAPIRGAIAAVAVAAASLAALLAAPAAVAASVPAVAPALVSMAAASQWVGEDARGERTVSAATDLEELPAEVRKNVTWFCEAGFLAFPLPIINAPYCDPGYYCPNIVDGINLTYPQICPPTIPCQLERLGSSYCEAQGVFEPIMCLPGYFCPNFTTMVPCPAGSYCMRGSYEPKPCPLLATCPAGSANKKDYTGLAIMLCLDAALVLAYLTVRFCYEPRVYAARVAERKRAKAAGLLMAAPLDGSAVSAAAIGDSPFYHLAPDGTLTSTPRAEKPAGTTVLSPIAASAASGAAAVVAAAIDGAGTAATNGGTGDYETDHDAVPGDVGSAPGNSKDVLEAGFRRCNKNLRLDLRFDNLGFTLPPPLRKTILSGVSGYIKPGRCVCQRPQ